MFLRGITEAIIYAYKIRCQCVYERSKKSLKVVSDVN